MKRKIVAVFLLISVIASLFSMTSCSKNKVKIDGPSKVVTDILGREVEIPEDPQRVTCMYAATAHMMALLDEGDKIVGCADGVRRDELMLTKYPDIANTSTPYHEGVINAEELASLNPDLILMKQEWYEKQSEREKLDELGIPYLVVDYFSIDQLQQCIKLVGEVFNKKDRADAYIKYMNDTFDFVEGRVSDIPKDQRKTVYHSLNEAAVTDIVGSYASQVFEKAALRNVAVEAGIADSGKSTNVTLEEIYNWDPDIILCNEYAVTEYIGTQKKWASLKAVQTGNVHTLPIGASRWGHHGSIEPQMAVLYMAQLIYADRFADIDMATITKEYYSQYFGLDFDDETIGKILSGKGMRESAPTVSVSLL